MAGTWSNDREEEFVAMMEARPELFDNTEMNFTNKTVKMNSWLELAQHFHINEKELRKKWDSLRTQYSRYTKLMYGSDGRFFTPRQQWIMQRLRFLDPHIKRRTSYCSELDYEVTVVENGGDDPSPVPVDVDGEADSLNKLAMNPDTSRLSTTFSKRAFQDDDSDSPRSCAAKKLCIEKSVPPIFQKAAPKRRCEADEDEESDSASLRRMVCSTVAENEKRDERWDGFSAYVASCIQSLTSPRNKTRAQKDVCLLLQRHMDRDADEDGDGPGESDGACQRACMACCTAPLYKGGSSKPATSTADDQDDLEPFLKSMSIIMRRLPGGERSQLKFRIHELVHRAEMRHLEEHKNFHNFSVDPSF